MSLQQRHKSSQTITDHSDGTMNGPISGSQNRTLKSHPFAHAQLPENSPKLSSPHGDLTVAAWRPRCDLMAGSRRFRGDLTAIHRGFTATSQRPHGSFTAVSRRLCCDPPWSHWDLMAASGRFHCDLMVASLRPHGGLTAVSQRPHCDLMAVSKRPHCHFVAASPRPYGDLTVT